jgi:hypothetical protein
MADAEQLPKGAPEELEPKVVKELLYEVVARRVLAIVQTEGQEIGRVHVEEILRESGVKEESEADRGKVGRLALDIISHLETAGLLWSRGSHFESKAALAAQNFDDEHLRRHPFDNQRTLTKKQIKKLPPWLAELVRSHS